MTDTFIYIYDPLCGWCYGAMPAVSELFTEPGLNAELLPAGLFAAEGVRRMNEQFAAYAWANDQRIERLTGQHFSDTYRRKILGDREQVLDSGAATLALTAVALTDAAKADSIRESDVLKAIQHARYVDGRDVTSLPALASLLENLGLEQVAAKIRYPDQPLVDATRSRIQRARGLMQELGVSGVPQLIIRSGEKKSLLNLSAAYANPRELLSQLRAASAA